MKPPNIGILLSLCLLLISFSKIKVTNAEDEVQGEGSTSLGISDETNENKIISVCGFSCHCYDETVACYGRYGYEKKKIFTTSIQISKDNFTLKVATFYNTEIKMLKKDFILPGRENTVKELYFSSNQMNHIENEAFDKFAALKKLSIVDNELKNISENVLNEKIGLTLEELNLRNNQLESIPSKAFKNMKNLTSLNLSGNKGIQFYEKIDGKNVSIFHESLANLKTLNLMGCNITTLPDKIFKNLRNLESLDLSLNPLTTLQRAIKNLPNLRNLRIIGSSLTQINNENMKFNTKLESLIIYDSKVSRIDDCTFCNLPNLKIVDFSNNENLSYIHENAFGSVSIGKTPELKYFSIENCNVSILSPKLLDWKNITHVDIKGNPFTCNCSMAWLINDIEEYKNNFQNLENQTIIHALKCQSPAELKNIKFTNLAGNFCKNDTEDHSFEDDSHIIYVCGPGSTESDCRCIDQELKCEAGSWWRDEKLKMNHTNIQILANNFTIINASFSNANIKFLLKEEVLPDQEKNIEKLEFFNTQIESIENGTFDKFTSLKILKIFQSKLMNITEGILTPQLGSTLLELDLSFNQLSNLNPNAFQYLFKLNSLSLEGNQNIQWSTFIFPKALENLKTLDLRNSEISTLPNFEFLRSLETLRLDGNQKIFKSATTKEIFPTSLSNLKHLHLTMCYPSKLDENIFVNLKNLETLDLSHNLLSSLPKAIGNLLNLRNLHFSYNSILELNAESFQNNTKLETIIVSGSNSLQRIENCTFCNLPNLKKVNLNENYGLSNIHENAFGSISTGIPKTLESFSFAHCNVGTLYENLLDWKNTKHINAIYNTFTCDCSMGWLINELKLSKPILTKNFEKWNTFRCYSKNSYLYLKDQPQCVNEIIMDSCGENSLTIQGCKCENQELHCQYGSKMHSGTTTNIKIMEHNFVLKKASFAGNLIKELKNGQVIPGRENAVQKLNLHNNLIEAIENGTFDKFISLTTLDLGGNLLKTLKDGIFTEALGSSLLRLDLSQNKFEKINLTIFNNLTQLTYLSLANNDKIKLISIFPEAMVNLKLLYLDGCKIKKLDENIFANLKNLENLGLSNNPLTTIPKAVNSLSNLQNLYIQNTKISKLNFANAKFIHSLEMLDASTNSISKIENCTFCGFFNLKTLYLQENNKLSVIHENAFGSNSTKTSLPILDTLFLQNCNVSSLSENLLDWNKIQNIQIDGNQLNCDCSIAWLIQGLKPISPWYFPKLQNSVKNQDKLICNFPNEMKNIKFSNISKEFCFNETFKEIPKTHLLWWILLSIFVAFVFIGIGVGSFIYVRRYRSQSIPYRREDEDKLEEDFDTNDDEEENV